MDDLAAESDDDDDDDSGQVSLSAIKAGGRRKRMKSMSAVKSRGAKKGVSIAPLFRGGGGGGGGGGSGPSRRKSAPAASSSSTKTGPAEVREGCLPMGKHKHNHLTWLKDGNRKDGRGRLPSHPRFDARTLKVDRAYYQSMTPAKKQWWDVKASHFDCVLCFKVGKFYELFHMDADVGVRELGLIYMKGEEAHSGFPEIAYAKVSGGVEGGRGGDCGCLDFSLLWFFSPRIFTRSTGNDNTTQHSTLRSSSDAGIASLASSRRRRQRR